MSPSYESNGPSDAFSGDTQSFNYRAFVLKYLLSCLIKQRLEHCLFKYQRSMFAYWDLRREAFEMVQQEELVGSWSKCVL